MSLKRQIRAFGLYLVICSLYQAGVYARHNGMASGLDPRLGLWLLPGGLPGGESLVPWIEWSSTACLFCLGLWLALRGEKSLVATYVIAEGVLALPTGLYVGVSLFGDAGHLTATGADLFIILGTFLAFTCVPLALGVYFLVRKVQGDERQVEFDQG